MQVEQFIHDMSEGWRLAARGMIGFNVWALRTFAESQRDFSESIAQVTQESGRHLASIAQHAQHAQNTQHQATQRSASA